MYLGSVLGGITQGMSNLQAAQAQDQAIKKQQFDLEQQRATKAKELALAQYGSGVAGQLFAPPPVSQPQPQTPMPGQASQPMAPPGGGQPQVPMNMGQSGQQGMAPPAPAIPPYQTVQGAAAQRQAAPQPAQQQMMAPPSVGAQSQGQVQPQGQQGGEITVNGIISALRSQNVPQEYWMDVINQYTPIMNAQNKQEATMLKQQLDMAKLGLQEKNTQSMIDYRARKGGGAGGAGGAGGMGGGVGATGVYDAMPDAEKKRVDFYAGRAMNGDYSWRTGLSRNTGGANFIKAVDERVADLSTQKGITPGKSAAAGAKAKGLAKALADRQKYVANANQFSQTMNGQMDIVLKSLDAGSAGGIPLINKWKNATREQILGSPELTTFDNALSGLAREHARFVTGLTSNAQLTAAATSTGDRLLNRNMSPEQIKATIKEMKDEQKAAVSAGKNEVQSIEEQLSTVDDDESKDNTVHWDDLK